MQLHRQDEVDANRDCGNIEFQCTLNTPSLERLWHLLQLCKSKRTAQLRHTLLDKRDLLRMPISFWEEAGHHTDRGGWWVRACSEELTKKCTRCRRIWPAGQLEREGCTDCKETSHKHKQKKEILAKCKTGRPKIKQTLGLVMRIALPEEIEKMHNHNLISDSTLILPHIQSCLEDMMQEMGMSLVDSPTESSSHDPIYLWFTTPELGHPLIVDNHERYMHPLVGPFLREYLSSYDGVDDDDDAMGHLYTGHGNTRTLARSMLDSWDMDPEDTDEINLRSVPPQFLRSHRERFSTPHVARDPGKIVEIDLDIEDPRILLRHPPPVGAVRFYHEPESTDSSHAGVKATTFQGLTAIITQRGPYQLEGARWHLLTQVFSTAASFKTDLQAEILLQKSLDSNPKYRSFSWQSLRRAKKVFGAETYIGETGLTTPPFFANSRRGSRVAWGKDDDSPIIVNWNGLDASEQSDIIPTLLSKNDWILLTHPLGSPKSITPPFPSGAQRILHTKGHAGREKGWWKTRTDKLASHGLDTEVWVSSHSNISRADMLDLEELLNSESTKDLLDMRADGVEEIYWSGTESGLMDILNFPGVVYATDGSKGSSGMGTGFYRHDTRGGGCWRVGGGPEGGSSGRAEFGAACLALEDSLTHSNPIAIITDSKGLMTVSTGWVGKGKDPLLRHSPDGDILACIISLLQRRVALGLFTIFIKIRAHRGEFFNEKADRWADEGREDKDNVRWGGPSLKPIFSCQRQGLNTDALSTKLSEPEYTRRWLNFNSLSMTTSLPNSSAEWITAGLSWESTDWTNPCRINKRDASYKA